MASPLAALLLAAPIARAQDLPPASTLHVDVSIVQLTCSASNRHTHAIVPITSAQQLRVYQDNQLQPNITLRPAADLPLTLGILLDTSGSESGEWNRMRSQTLLFLQKTLRPGDRIFILTFDSRLLLLQDLTAPSASPVDILSTLKSLTTKSGIEVDHRKISRLNNGGTRA
ncbi:MAG: hypothetical protein HIU91_02015 [Acidobacteria bacterium]|nr:hypothetical protein [Acidobacteriota bacterium]